MGSYGFILNKRSVIHTLISLELMYLGLSLILILNSINYQNQINQIIALFILASVAAEAAVGLSLLVFRFRIRSAIDLDSLDLLQG